MSAEIERIIARIQSLERDQNLSGREEIVSGNTHSTANTQLKFKHNLGSVPTRWFPVKGNIYVKDLDAEFVDVRSTGASENFTIIVKG